MQRILGQPRAIEILHAQLSSGRLHHASIFHGPGGVGKFTTAMAFARVLLCHDRQTTLAGAIEACGSCASCKLFDVKTQASPQAQPDDGAAAWVGTHPDLHVVTKELARYSDDAATRNRKLTQIPVQVLRSALLEPVYRAAQLRHGKVFIIDEAQLLNDTGQNLLLKTLEEPPAGTVIILVTASEDRLLPTIRSRAQRVAFVPLPDPVIEQWLDRRDAAGEVEIGDNQRRWLVSFAQGSLGRAELAIQYDLAAWARRVLPAVSRRKDAAMSTLGQDMARMIDQFAKTWVDRHDNASKEAANQLAAGLMWSLIATHARGRLSALSEGCDGSDPAAAEATLDPWLNVIDALDEAQRLLSSNVNLSLVCDHLVSRIARVETAEVAVA